MMQRKGSTVIKLLIAVLAIVALAMGGMYFFSDVYRTRIDTAAKDFAEWTPENIAKDPVGYLNFCETETNKALTDLKANEIAISQNRAKLVGMKDDADQKVKVGNKAIDELKLVYLNAQKRGSWPATWRGEDRDEDWTKRQIVSLYTQTQSQKRLSAKIDGGIKSLDVQTGKVQDGRAKAQEQLAEINTNREMLKVQKLTDDLTNRLVAMKGALQATVNTASESTGVISLDDLAKQTEGQVDDSAFDKIMGKDATTKPVADASH